VHLQRRQNLYISALFAIPLSSIAAYDSYLDMTLEELMEIEITSSSFFHLPANQTPGSSWIFTQQEIQTSPIVSLKDIFEFYTPAIAVSPSGFSGATLGVRGVGVSDNSKTMFMVNGQNLNQRSLYGYQAGLQSVLFGDVDYIEVVNGPGAILHGSGAINNLINVIPKNGSDYSGVHSSAQYGFKDELKKIEVDYGYSYGADKNYYLYVGAAQADGFKPESFLEQGDLNSPPGADTQRHVFEIPSHYRFSGYFNHQDLEFQTQFQRIKRSFNKASGLGDANVWRGHWQTLWASRLKYDLKINEKRSVEFSMPFEFYDHGLVLNESEGEKGGRENHVSFRAVFYQEWSSHKLALGAGLGRRNFDAQKQYFESDKLLLEESLNGDLKEVEIFLEDVLFINNKWTVSFGLRYDSIDYGTFYEPEANVNIFPNDLSAATKRLATAYQINKRQTIKVSYQEGFRHPDTSYYLTLGVINDALTNASLEPLSDLKEETVESYEINYLHKAKDLPLNLDINLYYNTHEGTLSWADYNEQILGTNRYNVARAALGWGPGSYANVMGKYKAYGTEIIANWQPDDETSIRASYAYSQPSGLTNNLNTTLTLVNESGENWASYPEHLYKLAVNWGYSEKFHFNVTSYFSPNVDVCVTNCNQPKSDSVLFYEKDRFRLNARINYDLTKNASWSFIVQNIFENEGAAVGFESREGPGREGGLGDDSQTIYLSFNLKF